MFVLVRTESLRFRLTLCDPIDCSLPGSSVHGLLQVRILEWVAILFSRGAPRPRDQTRVCLAGGFFTTSATWEAPKQNVLVCALLKH